MTRFQKSRWLLHQVSESVFVIFCLLLCFQEPVARADELTLKSPKDWDKLFDSCESSWEQYDGDLNRLRSSVKRQADGMTEDQYLERWRAKDPLIGFIRIHWPSIFAAKDPGWDFYKKCADLNWKVRKELGSAAATKVEKEKEIANLRSCLAGLFSRNKNVVPEPFDRLLRCYEKHSRR